MSRFPVTFGDGLGLEFTTCEEAQTDESKIRNSRFHWSSGSSSKDTFFTF